jgi:3-dehydroquinate synthase
MAQQTIFVRASTGTYPVAIGRENLHRLHQFLAKGELSGSVFVVSSPRVWRLWGRQLLLGLRGHVAGTILFDDAERAKNLQTVETVCRQLVRAGAERESVIVALGGGVVGDVAGFVAASFMRGVRLVHVPTTLVAQVDSSIGGKTGVNLPEGKNLIGSFHQPQVVVSDPQVLSTLPARHFRSGLFEAIKYGVVADRALFTFLETSLADVIAQKPSAIELVIGRCATAKASVVQRDERETGLRQILNFGHTIGHALEAATDYELFLHGEAVGWGMLAATHIGMRLRKISGGDANRIFRLIGKVGGLPDLSEVEPGRVLRHLRADKKTRYGRLRWVLPRQIARAESGVKVPDTLVRQALEELAEIREQPLPTK